MENPNRFRCWKDDYKAVEAFCEKYGLCYGNIVYDNAQCNVFFTEVDGDEVECCLSKNGGDLGVPVVNKADSRNNLFSGKQTVKYTDIVLYIPLNERDLTTDVCAKLLEYCLANGLIDTIHI